MREQIYQQLEELVNSSLQGREQKIVLNETTDLIHEAKMDSMEVVTILVKTEIEFGIEIREQDINASLVSPISNLVEYIQERLKQ